MKFGFGFTALVLVITLCSSIPVNKQNTVPFSQSQTEKISKDFNDFSADGKLSYKELKSLATTAKGEKLSLKEKIALSLFSKKISNKAMAAGEGKSQWMALILCALLGYLGIHRFYLGYTWQGIVQLLTAGGCGIWLTIDWVRIIMGDLKPKDGEYGTKL